MKIGSISYRLFLRQSISVEKDLYTIYCKLIQGNEIKVISTGIRVPKEAWITKKYSINIIKQQIKVSKRSWIILIKLFIKADFVNWALNDIYRRRMCPAKLFTTRWIPASTPLKSAPKGLTI